MVRLLAPLALMLALVLTGSARADLCNYLAQSQVSHGCLNSDIQSTDLVTDLRGFTGMVVNSSTAGNTGSTVHARGLAAVGDGLGGQFYWMATSTATDDGANVIRPTAIASGAPGRWLRWVGMSGALPPQTVTGASYNFGPSDLYKKTRRSNGGVAMTDTLPAATTPGLINGARLDFVNVDASASDTLTAGAGTTVAAGCTPVVAGRNVMLVYDLATTTWRGDANSCAAALTNQANSFTVGQSMPTLQLATGSAASLNVSCAPTPACTWLNEVGYAYGSTFSAGTPALHYFGTTDQSGSFVQPMDNWLFAESVSGYGNKTNVQARVGVSAITGVPTGIIVAADSYIYSLAGSFGTGYGVINDRAGYSAQLFGAHQLLQNFGTNTDGLWGDEADLIAYAPTASIVGFQATKQPGNTQQGIVGDFAFSIVNQDDIAAKWVCGYCEGSQGASWPIDVNYGTIRGSLARIFSGTEVQGALYGTDDRVVTIASGGEAIAEPNFAVDGAGNVNATSLSTTGVLRGQTATLYSVTPLPDGDGIAGGLYTYVPTVTVAPPPSGTTATVTVTSMSLGKFVGYGSTGSGYLVNDLLNVRGGTGSPPTLKAATVGIGGAITSCSISVAGALTVIPPNPVYPTTGSGTGAAFNVVYDSSGAATSCAAAVTGKNYVVGDPLSTGGTGTQGVLTVDAVDTFGGILAAHPTTAGNLTVLPASPVAVTGGSGTLASPILGFSILTMSYTPGSGYVMEPAVITAQQSIYRTAHFNAVMQAVPTSLQLNPTGPFGATVGTPTGGDKGFGTFNAAALYQQGVSLASSYFPLAGTTAGGNAAAGNIGEYICAQVTNGGSPSGCASNFNSPISLANNIPSNVTSISLTAGDWDVSAQLFLGGATTTVVQYAAASIGSTSATLNSTVGFFGEIYGSNSTMFNYAGSPTVSLSPARINISATTTYYLVGQSGFTTSTESAYGIIRARRIR